MAQEYGVTHPKLLVFGEYGILLGGSALTLPLNTFSARLDFFDNAIDIEIARRSNKKLKEFAVYLGQSDFMNEHIDVEGLMMDIAAGLYLLSDIPIGYGLGSSGVLCAAIYKAFARNHKPVYDLPDHLLVFKNLFSSMEAFFHGKSSGLDPLACLVGKPLLIRKQVVSLLHSADDLKGDWFLVDSGLARDTGTLVNVFLSKCYSSQFKNDFQSNYLSFINNIVDQIQSESKDNQKSGRITNLANYMEAISGMQLRYFSEMIPSFLVPFWQQGLDTGLFFLKLLGAGGGGYFLGLSQEKTTTEEMASAYGFKLQWLDL